MLASDTLRAVQDALTTDQILIHAVIFALLLADSRPTLRQHVIQYVFDLRALEHLRTQCRVLHDDDTLGLLDALVVLADHILIGVRAPWEHVRLGRA